MTESELVESYMVDFLSKTGRCLKVQICSRWETLCTLPMKMDLPVAVQIILDATNWKFKEVFNKKRDTDSLYKRGLIYFILVTNKYSLLKIGAYTRKDHSTVINSYNRFSDLLSTEPLSLSILREVIEYINANYTFYKHSSE